MSSSDSEAEESEAPAETSNRDSGVGQTTEEHDPVDLAAQLDVLTEENQRLREEYARAKRAQYRRSALALVGIGVVAIAGGVLFPSVRALLIVLGATGLFGGVLTYYLSSERFIAAEIGRGIYTAFADDAEALVAELGLRATRVYVPVTDERGDTTCRLFVPQHEDYDVPDRTALRSLFVVTTGEAARGIALEPKGQRLFDEFERTLSGRVSPDPGRLGAQLADSLVEQLELCEQVTTDIGASEGRATFGIVGSAFGPVDRFDHPIASLLAVGLATGLETPVELETAVPEAARADYLVTVRWVPDGGPDRA